MAESVPVTCPACRREHVYAAPTYPCACGAPVTPALDSRAVPESVTHHTWDEGWVTIPCATCGRADQWPRPELGCPCGTVLRVPVAGTALDGDGPADTAETEADSDGGSSGPEGAGAGSGEGGGRRPPPKSRPQRLPAAVSLPLPRTEPVPRPAFQPVTIRTARDAVTAAALYLRWLGYRDIRRADQRPPPA